jgi:hypothetical protein
MEDNTITKTTTTSSSSSLTFKLEEGDNVEKTIPFLR